MSKPKSSRVVVITGASSGIGRVAARLFAERGWRVGMIARGEAGLEDARAALAGRGAEVEACTADVADSKALRNAAARIAEALGPIDVWINNAAVGVFAAFTDMTETEFRRVTEVNYLGVVNGTRVALEQMRPRDSGTVVNVCSAIGFRGTPLQTAYSGAKYAMRGFTEALRAELLHERSRVHLTTVYPPSVNTPFYNHSIARIEGVPRPPPPVYQPELVAESLYFAATSRRRDVLVGGQTVQVGLLNALAPSLADWLLARFGPASQNSSRQDAAAERDPRVFAPSPRFAGERGAFNPALPFSLQFWASRNREALGLGFGAVALTLLLLTPRR